MMSSVHTGLPLNFVPVIITPKLSPNREKVRGRAEVSPNPEADQP